MRLTDPRDRTQPVVPDQDKGRWASLLLPCFLALFFLSLVVVLPRLPASAHGEELKPATALDPVDSSIDRPAASYPNCRFGIGQGYRPLVSYAISSLNFGWYLNWIVQADPPRPGGVEYGQVVHVKSNGYFPSGAVLANAIAANPGALWLIGNEPDRVDQGQDDVLPQDYARAYHDAYAFIKTHDPTAQVAAGSIVQPTPVRMQYLDIVLDTYASLYHEPLPADAWSIHSYILREASCSAYPDSCWGAEVPRGITATHGMLYTLDDTDNLSIFQQRIVQFRQWMKDRGYRNVPLLITEYGTLLPYYDPANLYYDSKGRPFDETRARDFMYGTFDFMSTATDPNLGYPADENRLVQRWLWYSLDDMSYGGALFDPYSFRRLQLGADFGNYVAAITPTFDIVAVRVGQMPPVPYLPTDAVTVTLQSQISIIGNNALAQNILIRFFEDNGNQIGADQIISGTLPGEQFTTREVTVTWPNLTLGAHAMRVVADAGSAVYECNKSNNQVTGIALVATRQLFLPVITRQ